MLKAECEVEGCRFIVRVAASQVANVGPPHCPKHGAMAVHPPPEYIFADFARTSMEAHSISGASQLKNIKFYSCSTSHHVRLQRADGANAIHLTLQSSVTDIFF